MVLSKGALLKETYVLCYIHNKADRQKQLPSQAPAKATS